MRILLTTQGSTVQYRWVGDIGYSSPIMKMKIPSIRSFASSGYQILSGYTLIPTAKCLTAVTLSGASSPIVLTRDEFEQDYPDADPMPWEEGAQGDEYKSWNTATPIRIAEYFVVETKAKRLVALASGHIGYWDDLAESVQAEAKANPKSIVKEREVQAKTIKWYKITAKEYSRSRTGRASISRSSRSSATR